MRITAQPPMDEIFACVCNGEPQGCCSMAVPPFGGDSVPRSAEAKAKQSVAMRRINALKKAMKNNGQPAGRPAAAVVRAPSR